MTLAEPANSVPNQGLRSPTQIISHWTLSLSSSSSLSIPLIHQLYPFSHKLSARPERCEQPYLQRGKRSEVNNEARLLCFMCHGEIATWLKSQLGETVVQPFVSGLHWNVSHCSSCQSFTLAKRPFTANSLNHVGCALSCCLSPYRDRYKCC